jgi:hypothetical protein
MAMTPTGMRTEEALRETQRQLASELAATQQLQQISIQLINASDPQALYEKILDAAVAIMRSDFASMQMFYPERGELRLLAYREFSPTAAAAGTPRAGPAPTAARGGSRRTAPMWTGSPAARRGHPVPARTSPGSLGAPIARLP